MAYDAKAAARIDWEEVKVVAQAIDGVEFKNPGDSPSTEDCALAAILALDRYRLQNRKFNFVRDYVIARAYTQTGPLKGDSATDEALKAWEIMEKLL